MELQKSNPKVLLDAMNQAVRMEGHFLSFAPNLGRQPGTSPPPSGHSYSPMDLQSHPR